MNRQDILLYIWLCNSFSYGSVMPCKILKTYFGDLRVFFDNLKTEIKKFRITKKSAEKLNKKDMEELANKALKCHSEQEVMDLVDSILKD